MDAARKKILVVDDDPDALKMLSVILENMGYGVVCAGTGKEALEKLENDAIDLVLLDVVMPDMDGYTFFQTLRSDVDKRDLPVIVLTGKPDMKEIFKMEGVSIVMDKPFEPQVLLSKINEMLS
ncbi:MAG: response regulator [Candidatus Omnitrophota bacterium]